MAYADMKMGMRPDTPEREASVRVGRLCDVQAVSEHNELFSAGGGMIPEVVGLPRGWR